MRAKYKVMKYIYLLLNNRSTKIYKKEKVNIFDTAVFKLWKYCANRLRKKKIMTVDYSVKPAPTLKRKYKKHIASQGYGWSGSGAVIGFLAEFSDVTVLAASDPIYSKEKISKLNIECPFFWQTNFIQFINSFACDSAVEKDWQIKRFIQDIYNCYDNYGSVWYEKNQFLYKEEFLYIALNFICSVIDLDNYTFQFMKDKRFPTTFNSSDEKLNKCCFMKQKGVKQYLFYKFKNITQEEFDHYVKQFIEEFLNLFDSNEIFISDQMFVGSILETINKYLTDNPIKQICTYRDPRDQYLSRMRCYINEPASPSDFIDSYKHVINHLNNPYEHRLMVRFEDLVLKYDETTQKIMNFCGIDSTRHVRPKAVFDPAISVVNIGAYKYFADQDFMRKIEEQLGEYCYYPEKENLSEEAWNLLKSVQ